MLEYRNAGGAAVGTTDLLSRLLSRVHHYHLTAEGDDNAGAGGGSDTIAGSAGGDDLRRPALGDDGSGGGGADTGGAAEGGTPPTWREDWRETLSGGDDAALKQLKRFASPENFAKSYRDLQRKLSTGSTAAALPENATDDEVAAYRKAQGVPEKADGYGLAWAEGIKPSETDTATLAGFTEFMHGRHVPPGSVKAAFDWYQQHVATAATKHLEAMQEATLENLGELKAAYPGREYKRNMTITEDFLGKHFDGDEAALDLVLGAEVMTKAGPVKIKNFAPFIKGMVAMARSYADEEALVGGDGNRGGKSIEDEIAELRTKSVDGKITKAEDARLNDLYAARVARENRQGRGKQAA